MTPEMDLLGSDSKRALLLLIKRRGQASLDEAAEETGLSRTTLREHIANLERDGLVRRFSKPEGRGRPVLYYRLTERGEGLFPTRDGVLLRELLGYLENQGHSPLVDQFFGTFWEARQREIQYRLDRVPANDRQGRINTLRTVLTEQGFMPEIEDNGTDVVIRECNCPFPEAVRKTRLPCILEARFFESVMQGTATRVTYIPDGHTACTYTFSNGETRQSV